MRFRLAALVAGAGAFGFSFGSILGGIGRASPLECALVAVFFAAVWVAAGSVLNPPVRPPLWPWWLGLGALGVSALAPRAVLSLSGLSFERAGLLWIFGEWERVESGIFLTLVLLGGVLAGIWFLLLFAARNDRRSLAFIGVSTLAVAGVWRSVLHPPSGDEPALLFAAWHWLGTGTLDLSNALGGPAEVWSRVVEFRDELHVYHTAGLPGGPRYTVHGFLLPAVFGVFLAPAGRIGLMVALAACSGAVVWGMARLVRELTGRPPSNLWLAAVLAGSPVTVYTVFISPDLIGGGLFALGCLGIARRRVIFVAVAVMILPWLHHKLALSAAGLVAGAFVVSPRVGLRAGGAMLLSVIPEFFVVNRAFGIPVWPPGTWWAAIHGNFTAHPHVGTYSVLNWMRSIPGLLVDRYAGLIHYPAWVLAAGGFVSGIASDAAGASRRRALAGIAVACAPYLAVLLSYNTWMGGDGAPGRMLVMVFAPLAIGFALLERRTGDAVWFKAAVWIGIAHAQALVFMPPLAFRSAKLKVQSLVESAAGFDPLCVVPGISLERTSDFPGFLAIGWMIVLGGAWWYLGGSWPVKSGFRRR